MSFTNPTKRPDVTHLQQCSWWGLTHFCVSNLFDAGFCSRFLFRPSPRWARTIAATSRAARGKSATRPQRAPGPALLLPRDKTARGPTVSLPKTERRTTTDGEKKLGAPCSRSFTTTVSWHSHDLWSVCAHTREGKHNLTMDTADICCEEPSTDSKTSRVEAAVIWSRWFM